jgi:hypothetical protein
MTSGESPEVDMARNNRRQTEQPDWSAWEGFHVEVVESEPTGVIDALRRLAVSVNQWTLAMVLFMLCVGQAADPTAQQLAVLGIFVCAVAQGLPMRRRGRATASRSPPMLLGQFDGTSSPEGAEGSLEPRPSSVSQREA